ncbi:outer membrane lipoprotein-sorting protein [Pseudomonadota bacterium]
MQRTGRKLLLIVLVDMLVCVRPAFAIEPQDIVRQAIDHWRGVSSIGEMTMIIHRPDWERTMSIQAWTQDNDKSLVRVTAPRKDRGNSTLMLKKSMWNFSPKVNRIIKVPSSMMGQGWMGSDFSNKDVSRADDIVDQYTHVLLETVIENGKKVYVVESTPLEEAAVVWGKEVLRIREDLVVLEQKYYDQEDVLVQQLESLKIGDMGGRIIALQQRMSKVDESEHWTELQVKTMRYDVKLDDSLFTLANLRNPRH